MNTSTFSKTLNILCEKSNKRDVDIARDLKISKSTISRWRTGERTPKLSKILEIANYFNVDTTVFIGDIIDTDENDKNFLIEDKELYRSKRKKSDYFGDCDDTIEYLKKDPDLLMLYKNIIENDTIAILFDKVQKLTPKEVEQILKIIDTFDKELD